MIYQLFNYQEKYLLSLPETGMGYQVIDAKPSGSYNIKRFIVLNSEFVIDIDEQLGKNVRGVVNRTGYSLKSSLEFITLSGIVVLNEKQFRNAFNESKLFIQNGAIDNPVENANGVEMFVRLSAFDNDRRVDKINKCLLPGSFSTTEVDYLKCKNTNDDPIERYALPSDDKIQHAFYVQPFNSDTLQRGVVQPANGKRGGGIEAYFANGTSNGTFIKQTPY